MRTFLFTLAAVCLLSGCSQETPQEDAPETPSFEINAPGTHIKIGEEGVEVEAPGTRVKAEPGGKAEIEAPHTDIKIE